MPDLRFALFIIVAIVGTWAGSLVMVSHLGGWASLGDRYRCEEPFLGSRWNFQCGQFRWPANYNNCLTVGADPRGLFLWVFPLLRIAHPPLFIPWREISVSQVKVLWIKQVKLRLGRQLAIRVTINNRLAEKLKAAAGPSWPTGSVPI